MTHKEEAEEWICCPWFFFVHLLGWGNFETDNRRRRCNPWCTLCACHRQVQDGSRKKCNFQRKKTREGNKREKATTLECVKGSSSCCMDFFPRLFLHFPTATNKREKATTPGSFTLHFFSNSCTLRFCTLTHSRTRATFSLNCNFKGTAVTDSFDHLAFFANSEQVIPGSCLMMSPHL